MMPIPLNVETLEVDGSSSLDAQETTQQGAPSSDQDRQHPLGVQSRSQKRLHAPFRKARSKIINALFHANPETHSGRLRRLGSCGCCPALRRTGAGTIGVDLARCRDRLCPLCSIQRGREVRSRVLACVERWNSLRFVTLTLKASPASLEAQFARLDDAFTKLRRKEVWKDNVTAAVAVPEVTIGRHDQWHVHLHILCTGHFVPHEQLKASWHEVTGDSYIVHVESVHDRAHSARYVAGYIAGGNEVSKWAPHRIEEFATATHGRRMLRTYGTAKLPSGDDDDQPDAPIETTHLVVAAHVIRAAEAGCDGIRHAREIIGRLGNAHAAAVDLDPPDRTLPEVTAEELSFAVDVAEEIERMFPAVPDSATIEQIRRHRFAEPALKPPNRLVLAAMDPLF